MSLQGITIKPLVRILHVKLRGKEMSNMAIEMNDKVEHILSQFALKNQLVYQLIGSYSQE